MKRIVATLVVPLFIVACSGSNPFDPDPAPTTGGTGTTTTNPNFVDEDGEPVEVTAANIPASLANDLTRLSFNPGTQTLTVEGLTLDQVPFSASYQRNAALDRVGYQAYTVQDDPLDRHVTSYNRQSSNDAAVRGGVAASGGPRNRFFAGGYYERDGDFTPPPVTQTSGLVSYAGSYVGLTNLDGDTGDLLPVPAGTDQVLIPSQAAEVVGEAFVQADFADMTVEGNIFNRVIDINGNPINLPDMVLVATGIQNDGTFFGNRTEYQGDLTIDTGDYGGIFGGNNASGVAGVVHFDEFDGRNNAVLGTDFEEEYGVFVLDQCGQPVNAALCATVEPAFVDP